MVTIFTSLEYSLAEGAYPRTLHGYLYRIRQSSLSIPILSHWGVTLWAIMLPCGDAKWGFDQVLNTATYPPYGEIPMLGNIEKKSDAFGKRQEATQNAPIAINRPILMNQSTVLVSAASQHSRELPKTQKRLVGTRPSLSHHKYSGAWLDGPQ